MRSAVLKPFDKCRLAVFPLRMHDGEFEDDDRLAPPRSPLRVMQILAELAKTPEGTSLVRLSERLMLPKSSLYNLLRSLEAGNFVTSVNGFHRLGQEAFNLAGAILHHDGLAGRLRPLLQALQEDTAETVMLTVPKGDWSGLLFADVIEASSALRFTQRVGAERPLYSTSVGLALLAFASPEIQARYIAQTKLLPLTPTTITSERALRRVLGQTRKDGYVVNSGSVHGLTAIAVPIFGRQGTVVSSVGIAGPSTRIEERSKAFIKLVVAAGKEMTRLLGGHEALGEQPG